MEQPTPTASHATPNPIDHSNRQGSNRTQDLAGETPSAVDSSSISWATRFNAVCPSIHRLRWSRTCTYCNCRLLEVEKDGWCCRQGQWQLDPLPPLPDAWIAYFDGRAGSWGQHSREINYHFAMSALGVTGSFVYPPGGSNIVITGRTYHRLLDLHSGVHPLRWFLYDVPPHRQSNWSGRLPGVLLQLIYTDLQQINPYIGQLRQTAATVEAFDNFEMALEMPPAVSELAALANVTNLQRVQPRTVVLQARGDGTHQYLSIFSPLYEPLQYPLFFPQGVLGWMPQNAAGLTQIQWYRVRILQEPRFQLMSRLAQEYMVDMYSRVEDERLQFIRQGRERQYAQWRQRPSFHSTEGLEETQWQTQLPSTFLGSRAWSSNQVADALALCRLYGRPSLFITMTTNPHWPEILDQLHPRQQAADVPQIVVRVFHAKMRRLIQLLQQGSGGLSYLVHVVEFQKRGFPHCHMLLKLRHEIPLAAIDELVTGELPSEEEDPHLRALIQRFNLHPTTHLDSPHSRCNRQNKCVYHFPQPLQDQTTIDEFGRVHLRRRKPEDQWMVSTIPRLMRELQAHIHVDVCSGMGVIMYLYKYLFKGVDYARARVEGRQSNTAQSSEGDQTGSGERTASDEWQDYVNCRYLSSSEAIWRIFQYRITSRRPTVISLNYHLPQQQLSQMRARNPRRALQSATALLYYFHRPLDSRFDRLRFAEYYAHYLRSASLSNSMQMRPHWREQSISEDALPPAWVRQRSRQIQVTRLKIVSPRAGELFYLRFLLQSCPARGFNELLTVDDRVHETFQDAAVALGLFATESEAEQTLNEAVVCHYAPAQLRFLFAQLLIDLPTPARQLWDRFRTEMSADFVQHPQADQYRRALIDLRRLLLSRGSTLAQFELPSLEDSWDEVQRERDLLSTERSMYEQQWQEQYEQLNEQQRSYFDQLTQEVYKTTPSAFFVDGRAGRGKSFLLSTWTAYCRAHEMMILIVGSTALSVMSYARGQTAHSAFGIPIDLNQLELTSRIGPRSQRWQFLSQVQVVIWEELPMMHRAAFECAQTLMQVIADDQSSIFGHAMLIASGDFRQVAPVVKGASQQEIVEASLRTALYWPRFEILNLTTSMRIREDLEFLQWLDTVGDGATPTDKSGHIALDQFSYFFNVADAVDEIFPPEVLANPSQCVQRAMLSPINITVDAYNQTVLDRLSGTTVSLFASNWFKDDDPQSRPLPNIQEGLIHDYLATFNEPGIPQSELQIKRGAICSVMRNLSLEHRLVKNARVIVTEIQRHTVQVQPIIDGVLQASIHAIPRINFEFVPRWTTYTVCRRQFPLRLAYATTFNSCQGLTLERVVLDLNTPVFAHGQLYTAFSRVRQRQDLSLLSSVSHSRSAFNVVWPELLLSEEGGSTNTLSA